MPLLSLILFLLHSPRNHSRVTCNVAYMHLGHPTKTRPIHLQFSTMSTSNKQAALHQEGRLELALQSYREGAFKSYRAAADAYDVPRTTLQDRVAGIKPKRGSITKNRLLTPTEEETLTK